jgi:hypothetical protein
MYLSDEFGFGNSLFPRTDHNSGAMRIVTTDINTTVSAQFLKPNPNIGLDVFH